MLGAADAAGFGVILVEFNEEEILGEEGLLAGAENVLFM